jgi:hypothetical protein
LKKQRLVVSSNSKLQTSNLILRLSYKQHTQKQGHPLSDKKREKNRQRIFFNIHFPLRGENQAICREHSQEILEKKL